jgi:two-component system cell cycle sensor histidine kinase/response regulator CckA
MKTETLEKPSLAAATTPLRVLFLEPDLHDIETMLLNLQSAGLSIQPTVAQNQQQFRRALQQGSFDAVLSGYRLPDWNGLEALRELRAHDNDVPFLLVTSTLGDETAVACIKEGVTDYIAKEHVSRLPVALRRALGEKVLRDENKRVFTELTASEAHARQQFVELDFLYRTAPIGLAVFDRQLRFLKINDYLAAFDASPASAHINRSIYEFIPLIAPRVEECVLQIFGQGIPLLNVELCGKIGEATEEHCWFSSFFPIRAGDGSVASVSVVVLDITARKRAEEALLHSEARHRDLVDNSMYGIFHVASDGALLDFNSALLRILRCESPDILRSYNLQRDIFRYPEQYVRLMDSYQQLGQIQGAEVEWRCCDSRFISVRLHLRRVSLPDLAGTLEIIAEDVTEVRVMERRLQRGEKFEAIGQFAGGIAHDFNNVVGAILGWAEIGFDENRANPVVAERFSHIREQVDRAAALTRELLAFARRQVLQPRAVDLNIVCSGLASLLDKVIGENIEVRVVTAPLDPIKADPTQVEQVLMNLCINARDAMPRNGRLLIETSMVDIDESYCRSCPYAMPGRYAALSVSDTGIGMDPETRERIFEPFFSTKQSGKGTGMGLATVYGIVKQHGGFIHVYTEPGQGSLFRVYWPIAEGGLAEAPPPKVRACSIANIRGSETILLAEDHESILEMARQSLASLGYRVLVASNGEEALRLCADECPALAILDVVMPKLGGPAVAAKLLSRFENVKVLFTSGYSQEDNTISCAVSGAHYLQKPYGPTTLAQLVREILDQPATSYYNYV